jgi:threonine/homoserine/homoserine lactone efflux protein
VGVSTLLAFVPVAALLTITPGAATAMIVRNAARGGRRHALACTVGNEVGVVAWALLAAVGVAAIVATSAEVFAVVKFAGALVLILIGVQSIRGRKAREAEDRPTKHALRDGVLTSLTNPKLAVFYVALFPQFVPDGEPVLPYALAMAALLAVFDLAWYSTLALAVTRARRAFVEGPWARRIERFTGAVLIALGIRLALERR